MLQQRYDESKHYYVIKTQTTNKCSAIYRESFRTYNNIIDIVKTCQDYFKFEMPSTLWTKWSKSFDNKFLSCQNVFLCKITLYSI